MVKAALLLTGRGTQANDFLYVPVFSYFKWTLIGYQEEKSISLTGLWGRFLECMHLNP